MNHETHPMPDPRRSLCRIIPDRHGDQYGYPVLVRGAVVTSYVRGDACSHAGSIRLSRAIEAYWHKRGVKVTIRFVTIMESQHRQMICIRSNLSGREK